MSNRRGARISPLAFALVLAALLIGCGGSGDDLTAARESDAATAPDQTETASSSGDSAGSTATSAGGDTAGSTTSAAAASDAPGFAASVLPILEDGCAACHAPGAPGSTHLELATVGDARAAAPDIALVVEAGVMPPWPATDLSVPFVGDHSLSDDQRAAVASWVADGAPIDVDATTAIESTRPLQIIEDRDVVMTSAAGAYAGSTDVLDDYRCLIFDPGVTEPGWILATHFEPDQVEVVHHAIIDLASAELRGQAEALDQREPGPGWTCYGGNGLNDRNGGRIIDLAGWAPGAQPSRMPEGYAIPIQPGDFVVVQIHYHYDDSAPADLSRMVFDLASPAEVEAAGGSFDQLTSQLYLGAAEIPCVAGDTEPLCDRDAALDRVEALYGSFNRGLAEALTAICGYEPEDFAEMNEGTAWSSCDLPVLNPGRIVSIAAHMHELGSTYRMTLNPDTPDERVLLDIADWDFDWQFGYRPVEDIVLERGDVLRVECSWGRDRAPYEAVGYILWAEGTGDEMCYSNVTTAPG